MMKRIGECFSNIFKKYKIKLKLTMYAWCLMSNHLHLLMKEGDENISNTMKRIGVSYAGYYNWKYRTTGHLFQDRFRSENVEDRDLFSNGCPIYSSKSSEGRDGVTAG